MSVRPDLTLDDDCGQLAGAVKLYFSKTKPLGKQVGLYVATAVHWYAEKHLVPNGEPHHRHFFVVDVFDKMIYHAPRAQQRRREDLEFACEEIAQIWKVA